MKIDDAVQNKVRPNMHIRLSKSLACHSLVDHVFDTLFCIIFWCALCYEQLQVL